MKTSHHQFVLIISLAALLCLAPGCQKKAEEVITDEQAKALLDNAQKAYSESDLALIEKVWAPEYVLHDPSLPQGLVGLDALRKEITERSKPFPDKKLTFEGTFVKRDKIVAFFTWTGTHSGPFALPAGGELAATGKPIRFSGVYIGRVANGKLAEDWFFYNLLDMLQPLGFTLVPPQVPSTQEK